MARKRTKPLTEVGRRITARVLALGFALPDGQADYAEFLKRHPEIHRANFYAWLTMARIPTGENLDGLGRALHCDPWWLVIGRSVEAPGEGPAPGRRGAAQEREPRRGGKVKSSG